MYKIYKSHPTQFLLPNSWVELHMLQNVHLFTVQEPGSPQDPKIPYREALLSLVESFCGLLEKINADNQFYYNISGRPRAWEYGHTLFIQRNVNFIVCCALNAFSWQTLQLGQGVGNIALHLKYRAMRFKVTKVCDILSTISACHNN